eukprot:2847381-Lingulodinium_polyedra.AAC.1
MRHAQRQNPFIARGRGRRGCEPDSRCPGQCASARQATGVGNFAWRLSSTVIEELNRAASSVARG